MKIIDERRFSFIPRKKWKNLKEDDRKTLGSYKSYFGHYKRTEQKIKELEEEVKILKNKKNDYVKKMTKLNSTIDHLRTDYNFSFSISKQKTKNYYNFTISRRGHKNNNKTGGLGSPRLIEKHLKEFYKRKKGRLEELDRMGWDRFVRSRVMDMDGRIRGMIVEMISQDSSMKKYSINRNTLFPISK